MWEGEVFFFSFFAKLLLPMLFDKVKCVWKTVLVEAALNLRVFFAFLVFFLFFLSLFHTPIFKLLSDIISPLADNFLL